MSSKRTYTVAMLGIPEHERHVLANIFKLSAYRTRTYTLASSGEASEILIVDADDTIAMTEWQTLRGEGTTPIPDNVPNNGKSKIPTVMVTKERLSESLPHYIRRPFVATRVLSALDQITIRELSAPKQRIIGEESKPVIAKKAAPIPKTNPESTEPTHTALVVDDSKPVRKQIELELKLFGIRVEMAESGEQAFALLNDKNYDMVFLDVVLPGVDGYQICKAIKKDKLKKKTPVIMLTGKSSPFDRVKGTLAGCDTYLTKPVKQTAFQKVVKKYLNK
jgi:twitching motility two-component system response regulator PilG